MKLISNNCEKFVNGYHLVIILFKFGHKKLISSKQISHYLAHYNKLGKLIIIILWSGFTALEVVFIWSICKVWFGYLSLSFKFGKDLPSGCWNIVIQKMVCRVAEGYMWWLVVAAGAMCWILQIIIPFRVLQYASLEQCQTLQGLGIKYGADVTIFLRVIVNSYNSARKKPQKVIGIKTWSFLSWP